MRRKKKSVKNRPFISSFVVESQVDIWKNIDLIERQRVKMQVTCDSIVRANQFDPFQLFKKEIFLPFFAESPTVNVLLHSTK